MVVPLSSSPFPFPMLTYASLSARAEVVLAVLIANFTFEPSGKDIVWNNAGVAYPSVGRESKTPQMPLKVSAIRPLK